MTYTLKLAAAAAVGVLLVTAGAIAAHSHPAPLADPYEDEPVEEHDHWTPEPVVDPPFIWIPTERTST